MESGRCFGTKLHATLNIIMTKKIKLALLVVALGAAAYGGYYLAQKESTIYVDNRAEIEEAVEETARRYEAQLEQHKGDLKEVISQLQHDLIARLQRDESGGEASGGDVFYANDPRSDLRGTCTTIGGKRNIECDSWGVMQFKLTTVMHYHEVLYGEKITQKQALIIALDDDQARALASDIIFKVEGGVWNWSAAYKDESFYAYQIPFIRSLMEKVEG